MELSLWLVIAAGLLAVLYGALQTVALLGKSAGNARMQEIAAAIQEGAQAYLKRQYTAIALVGVVVLGVLWWLLGTYSAIGFLIGAVLSGAAGFAGMLISVRANVRTGDRFFRTGGEEFLVLAPRTDAVALRTLAERLRRDAAESLGSGEPRVTVSIGLATLRPGETASQWLARADAAMYQAKHEGRDRVVADPDPAAP